MDDNFKKDLIELLDAQFETKFIRLFNQGFKELVLPEIEELRDDIHEVKKSVDKLEARVDQMDRKSDVMNAKYLDHDKRIKDIEAVPVIAHHIKR